MLAAWIDYLRYWWWLPAIILFIVAWVFGGGYGLWLSIRRHKPDANVTLGRSIMCVLAAGSAGAFASGIVLWLLRTAGRTAGVSLAIPGLILASVAMAVMAYLVLFAMLSLSAKETLAASILPGAGVLLLGVATALAAGLPARHALRSRAALARARAGAVRDLVRISQALQAYEARSRGQTPPAEGPHLPEQLEQLAREGIADESILPPSEPGKPPKYFYLRPPLGRISEDSRLMACEFRGHHGGRAILMANGQPQWAGEDEFRRLLELPENGEFTKGYRAAGGT
ncbi:MAG: hypothetical protein ACYTF6_09265 [Planctomycetota bacterium]